MTAGCCGTGIGSGSWWASCETVGDAAGDGAGRGTLTGFGAANVGPGSFAPAGGRYSSVRCHAVADGAGFGRTGTARRPASTSRNSDTDCGRSSGRGASIQSTTCRNSSEMPGRGSEEIGRAHV